MKLDINESDLAAQDISGTCKSWRDRAKQLCKQAGLNLERFVKAAVAISNPGLRNGRLKSEQHRAWAAFTEKRAPRVSVGLRRVIAYLSSLFRQKKPLPVSV